MAGPGAGTQPGAVVTFADASTQGGGGTPAVVDPGLLTACPANACSAWASGPCATVIFVRVDEDADVDYALQGGPVDRRRYARR